ncbi:hypothetical protein [Sphaerisporangium aureirubrum]|uniref:Holliday junction nuclease RuvC n=1 Tax=Sphaerisporangium aureirubrum TaxID=1544736 RepID=A0ABW1NET7_9ACTN
MTPRVVGLDISLTASGIASSTGWAETVGAGGITKLPVWDRRDALVGLAGEICALVKQPDLAVLEANAAAAAYGGASERAGLWWLVVDRLRMAGVPVAAVTPGQLKLYALGKGSGTKGAVIEAVTRRWPEFRTGGDDDLCDAVVLCAMGLDHLGAPLAPMPRPHRAALDKVAWPEAVTT